MIFILYSIKPLKMRTQYHHFPREMHSVWISTFESIWYLYSREYNKPRKMRLYIITSRDVEYDYTSKNILTITISQETILEYQTFKNDIIYYHIFKRCRAYDISTLEKNMFCIIISLEAECAISLLLRVYNISTSREYYTSENTYNIIIYRDRCREYDILL